MYLSQAVLAAPLAAAAFIAPHIKPSHQVTIEAPLPEGGPGPFNAEPPFSIAPSSSALGSPSAAGASSYFNLCGGSEGSIQMIGKTAYRTYCYNSLWDGFNGLGYHETVESCESTYTASTISPKVGFHWYPSTGACYLFSYPTSLLYVYHYGNYEKVHFAPVDKPTPPEGPLCPLPQEGGWTVVAGEWHRLYCRGMAKASPGDIKNYDKTTTNMTECAKWAKGVGAKMWHWWQPYQDAAAGLGNGQRNCEAIMKMPDRLVPLRTKDTYISGVPESVLVDPVDMYEDLEL